MLGKIIFIILALFVLLLISSLWVKGIDFMNSNHKDYKGEDFLDEKVN
jgi:hypothetical protein